MNNELKEHIASLSEALNTSIHYEYYFTVMTDCGCSLIEKHKIFGTNFKTIHRATLGGIMSIKPEDFEMDIEEDFEMDSEND